MSTQNVTLKSWIEKIGIHEVAKALRVGPSTVWHWRRGRCLPTSERMLKITKLSRGALTIPSMTEEYWDDSNKKNRWQSQK